MSLNTITPALHAADQTIRDLLTAIDDKPVRYDNGHGHIVNTTGCRGLVARYVLIEAGPDAVHVGAVRLGLGTGVRGITTRQYLRPAVALAWPDGSPHSVEAFAHLLAVHVGMALDDVARAEAGRG